MNCNALKDKNILITGATSGIIYLERGIILASMMRFLW